MPRGRKPRDGKPFIPDMTASLFPEHEWDYVDKSVERVKLAWGFHHMMNPDGKPMLLAFSGGKDSICLFFICKRAAEELGIPMEQMFHVQYNVTTVDPPELVRFIREFKKDYPFIEMKRPGITMWDLIVKRQTPPTRLARYCCAVFKETSRISGGYVLTGVRRSESVKRKDRDSFEILGETSKEKVLLGDNTEDRGEKEYCMQSNSYVCNPIVDWTEEDVWRFIRRGGYPYCSLYDRGEARLGCILCPMGTEKAREHECRRYPGFKRAYIRAFQRMLDAYPEGKEVTWKDGEEVFEWWIHGNNLNKGRKQEEVLFDE